MGEGTDDLINKMKKTAESLGRSVSELASDVQRSIKKMDVEEDAVEVLKETEAALDNLGKIVERKRIEMERSGVKKTVKKDADHLADKAGEVVEGVANGVKDITRDLKKKKKK
ncbi:MAG: hypothetical protein ACMUIG_01045 [Thermoplasmatota archaeon]